MLFRSIVLKIPYHIKEFNEVFLGGSVVKNLSANEGDAGDAGSIPESGRSLGGGHGNLLQYSCLGNPMHRGYWQANSPWCHKELDIT